MGAAGAAISIAAIGADPDGMHVREDLRSRRMKTAWPGIPMYSSRSCAGWPTSSSTRNVNIVSRFGTSGRSSRTHTIRPRSVSAADQPLSSPDSGVAAQPGDSRASP